MANESDLELIEAYLDDALSADAVELLDRRLASEPDLTIALDALRTDRALRAVVWQAQLPADSAAQRVATRVVDELRRRECARSWGRWSRIAGALAACILFGFVAGWIGRGRAELPGADRRNSSNALAVTHTSMTMDPSGVYQVALTDDGGNVIAVQKFTRYEEAKQFADDLTGYEARRRQGQQGRAVLVSEHR